MMLGMLLLCSGHDIDMNWFFKFLLFINRKYPSNYKDVERCFPTMWLDNNQIKGFSIVQRTRYTKIYPDFCKKYWFPSLAIWCLKHQLFEIELDHAVIEPEKIYFKD